jgi:hypothetical protein
MLLEHELVAVRVEAVEDAREVRALRLELRLPGQTNQYLVGFLALAPAGIISAGAFFRP